ncbi:MAG: diguanylate cyclase, partial [Bacillota bacterium]
YFHHITGSDSILVSSVDRSDVFVPALSGVIDIVLGLLLLSVLTSVAFMTLFDRRYVRPVKALKARVAALLEGKSIADDPGTYPNREFLEIAGSMEGLTQRILSQKTEELNAILESSSDGILVLDYNDRILHYNTRFLILWGLAKNAAYQTFGDLELHKRLLEETACPHPSKQTQGTEIFYLKSGVILERHTKVLTGQGHIDGILCVFGDVTQKMKKEELLKEIANTDFLTGLNNRRYFTFLAAREFRRAAESREPLALLMIDIDNFKLINDTYGHDIGDRALKTSSMHLRHCSRQSDILGRYGGEEFTVLLPQTDVDMAVRIAERVRGHFENAAIEHKGSRISWTISIGVANLDGRVSSVKTLIKQADVACYMAKQNGRNCVKSYTGAQKKFRPEKE